MTEKIPVKIVPASYEDFIQKVDEDFFQKHPSETKKAAADEADLAYQLLQENSDIAKLIIATLQKKIF